ncbi:MAG: antibiotic biosynthesis monooxygenase family protein [Hyphomicrobiaceae bacterium]
MYIAMNRFRVIKERAHDFEQLWLQRESYLHEMPGFVAFHLLKGPEAEDHQLYASHTVWQTYEDFVAWTKSEAFRKAHARAGNETTRPLTLGGPHFEGFHALQEVTADGTKRLLQVG